MDYHVPHSPEWFKALESVNPMQAAATRVVLQAAGSSEVCSVCGDDPAEDYKVDGLIIAGVQGTIRLCDDCRDIRSKMHGESFTPLGA